MLGVPHMDHLDSPFDPLLLGLLTSPQHTDVPSLQDENSPG